MRTLESVEVVPASSTDSGDGETLSIVIPARDEADNLPHLLRSIAASSLRPIEVIVVDDDSTDDTAGVAAGFGATVIATPPKPSDWAGKTWACAIGATRATGSRLAFIDADVRLDASALDRLVAASAEAGGLVSVQPFHELDQPYEQLSALFNAVAVLGSGAFAGRRFGAPTRAAFGPVLVTSREDFDRVGGFARVKGSVIEDVELAQVYAAHALPVNCWLGGGVVSFRMYPHGLRSLLRGWAKNIALGARSADRLAVSATIVWVTALAAVATSAIIAVTQWVAGGRPPMVEIAAYVLVAAQMLWLVRRLGSFRPAIALLYPIPLVVFIGVFVRSAVGVALRRPVRWKGRALPTDAGWR